MIDSFASFNAVAEVFRNWQKFSIRLVNMHLLLKIWTTRKRFRSVYKTTYLCKYEDTIFDEIKFTFYGKTRKI